MNSLITKYQINDSTYRYPKEIPVNTFHRYCSGAYSQSGEEGILDKVLEDLNIKNGWVCEFGAWDGIRSSNTCFLVKKGWNSVFIEQNPERYTQLCSNFPERVVCSNRTVQPEGKDSLDNILMETPIPKEFAILSIDIDHNDYHVWKNVVEYTPIIVVIEYNPYRDPVCVQLPDDKQSKPCSGVDILDYIYPDRKGNGTSFRSMIELGLEKGYIPIACTGNIIFVKKQFITTLMVRSHIPIIITTEWKKYLYLYPEFFYDLSKGQWVSNNLLVYNCFIRDEFLRTGEYKIDIDRISLLFEEKKITLIESKEFYLTTFFNECDGGGSSVQRFISAYAIAKRLGKPYIHTTQKIWEHNRGNMTDNEWSERWNTLIPFSQSTNTNLVMFQERTMAALLPLLNQSSPINIYWAKSLIDEDISILKNVKNELRQLYDSNIHHPVITYNPKRFNVAVHVRSYSVTDCDPNPIRRLFGHGSDYDNYYYQTIESLKTLMPNLPVTFHIYSEGDEKKFERFLSSNSNHQVELHINEPVFDSLYHMVNADVFVASVSSLSYLVHVLTTGIVIAYSEQVHKWFDTTVLIKTGTDINSTLLPRILQQYNSRQSVISKPLIKVPTSKEDILLYDCYSQFMGWYGTAEVEHKEWWIQNSRKEWEVLDIGANIGLFTILIANRVKKVYAVEPFDITLKKLRSNLFLNNINNVEIIPKAVGKEKGKIKDKLYREWGLNPIETLFNFTTVDEIVFSRDIPINAIKIDVDSFDYEVLQGSTATLTLKKPLVVVELNHALGKRNQTPQEAINFMEKMGYSLIKIMDGTENWFFSEDEMSRLRKVQETLQKIIRERPEGFGVLAKDVHNAIEWDRIIRTYNCDIWIETGTYFGETTEYMALMYPEMKIITCEVSETQYKEAKKYLDKYPNITMVLESSEKVIAKVSQNNHKCPFFFLDAHWYNYWPILDELNYITRGIVCIHDFDINHPNYGFDVYQKKINLNKNYILPKIGERIVYGNNPESNYPLPCEQPTPRGRAYICYEEIDYLKEMPNLKPIE